MEFVYETGQKVFAEYGCHLYEAVCLKQRYGKEGPEYLLKYSGYGKRKHARVHVLIYARAEDPSPLLFLLEPLASGTVARPLRLIVQNNRWQNEREIFPFTEENRLVMLERREAEQNRRKEKNFNATRKHKAVEQKRIKKSGASVVKQKASGKSITKLKTSFQSSLKTKQGHGDKIKTSSSPATPGDLPTSDLIKTYLNLPPLLTRNLAYQHICFMDRMVLPLPRKPSLQTLLRRFRENNMEDKDENRKKQDEIVCQSLEVLFNAAIGQRLLWSVERAQYAHWNKRKKELPETEQATYFATIYGAEHFLRLLALLPELLEVSIPFASFRIAKRVHAFILRELIEYLATHQDEFFTSEYSYPQPEHVRAFHLAGL
eukprot:gene4771-8662_t